MQYVGHLVTALAAAHEHHHVGRGVPGQGLLQHGLARTESSRRGHAAALRQREQEVHHSLRGYEGAVGV